MQQIQFPSNDDAYVRAALSARASQQIESGAACPTIVLESSHAWLLEVRHGGRSFCLNFPLHVSRSAEDGYLCFEIKQLGLLSFGTSEADSLASLSEDFA